MSEAAATGLATIEPMHLAVIRRRAILSCAIGNFFELFDFTIYGYFAVAITRAFYPSGSMYGTYAAFGAAFLMRPLGALVLGAYIDAHGRRAGLILTLGLMSVGTVAIAVLPGYASIGLAAEAALKCREAGRAWAESYPAMEYRHGPVSVAGPHTLVWIFGERDESLVADIAMTGATVLHHEIDPMAELVRAQRVAVALAESKGLDPDNPQHLTRSVVLG